MPAVETNTLSFKQYFMLTAILLAAGLLIFGLFYKCIDWFEKI
jgi:hypothetical protein